MTPRELGVRLYLFPPDPPGHYPDSGIPFHVLDPIGTGFSQPGIGPREKSMGSIIQVVLNKVLSQPSQGVTTPMFSVF